MTTRPEAAMEFDVVIVGAGSGNTILTPDFDGQRVAIVERSDFGGTCLNRGCIPTKMFAYTADTVQTARNALRLGVDAEVQGVRWSDVVDRVFGRIDPIALGGRKYREGQDSTTVFVGDGRFVGENVLAVHYDDAETDYLTAPTIVLATGSSPFLPPIPGLLDIEYFTSDTIMRVANPPRRLLILGGGFIAMEMAHVFDALGSEVVVVARNGLLVREDEAVSELFTELSADRYDCHLSARVDRVSQDVNGEISVDVTVDGSSRTLRTDALLVATGRVPNSESLGLEHTGVTVDERGYVITDEYMRTSQPGVWALGDITNPMQLKHTANAEARIVAHNIAYPDALAKVDLWPVPHAVFGAPQVAAVGATEQELRANGVEYVVALQRYADVAYGWAMEDSAHFCKVLADPASRQLLGAHIVGPYSSMLIQQLVMGMKFGLTVDQMACGMLYVHPALSEVVENALLQL